MLTRGAFRIGGLAAVTAVLVVTSATGVMAQAARRAAAAKPNDDEAAIRAAAEAYQKDFNAGDAKALVAGWATDGELTDELGRTFHGRDEIEKEFEAIFADYPGAQVEIDVERVRFPTPDVAVESGTTRARQKDGPQRPPVEYTAVHVKRGGQWLLSSVKESRPAAVTSAQRLASLNWLVGEWKADLPEDKTYDMSCHWMPEKSFLMRSFKVLQGGKTISSGTQIIGWDPTLGQIVSWTFDSTGGIGHEMWADRGLRWRIAASSVLPDGATSLAKNLLTKTGDNAFTWQSVERSLNDQLLPDTSEVSVKRVSQ